MKKLFLISAVLLITLGIMGCNIQKNSAAPATSSAKIKEMVPYQPPVDAAQGNADHNIKNHADASIEGSIAWYINKFNKTGGVINLAAGTYYVQESIVVPNNMAIIGQGETSVLKADPEVDFDDHIINNEFADTATGQGVKNVYLKDFAMEGIRAVRKNCINIRSSDRERSENITVQGITASNCGRHGIHLKGANHVYVSDLNLASNGQDDDHDHNLYLLRVTDAVVRNVYTTGAASSGYSNTRLNNVLIENIVSENNGRRGLRIGGSKDVIVRAVTAQHNGLAPDPRGGDGIYITSDDDDNHSYDIMIEDCTVTENTKNGIAVVWSHGAVIRNCKINDNVQNGIFLQNMDNYRLQNNEIKNNQLYGISAQHVSAGEQFENDIRDNGSGDTKI